MRAARSRLSYIDHAKAIGIICICLGHFLPRGYWLKVILYSFHVPVFAYISGLLFNTPSTYSSCFQKTVALLKRILIPYTVWHIISAIVLFSESGWNWSLFFKTYFFLEGKTIWNDALWYLPAIFIVSLLFVFFSRITKGNNVICLCASLLAFVAFTILDLSDTVITLFSFTNFLSAKNLILLFGFYCLGFASAPIITKLICIKDNARKNVFIYASILIFAVSCGVSAYFNTNDAITLLYDDYNNPIRFVILAIILSISFVVSCAILPRCNISELLSANTLFIMSSHYLFVKYWLWANSGTFQHTAFIGTILAVNVILIYVLALLLLQKALKNKDKIARPLETLGISII